MLGVWYLLSLLFMRLLLFMRFLILFFNVLITWWIIYSLHYLRGLLLLLRFLCIFCRNCFLMMNGNCLLFFYRSDNLRLNKVFLLLLFLFIRSIFISRMGVFAMYLTLLLIFLLNVTFFHLIHNLFSMIILNKQFPHNLIGIKPIHTLFELTINKYTHFRIGSYTHLFLTKIMIPTITIYLIYCYLPMLFL